jgi:hypothetical protein
MVGHFFHLTRNGGFGGWNHSCRERFTVHADAFAREAARLMGVAAFARCDRIYLGEVPAECVDFVLRHEIVHLAQVQVALRTGNVASHALIEKEADAVRAWPSGLWDGKA